MKRLLKIFIMLFVFMSCYANAQTNMVIKDVEVKMSGDDNYWWVNYLSNSLCELKTINCPYEGSKDLTDVTLNYDLSKNRGKVIFRRHLNNKKTVCTFTHIECH